MKKAGLIFQVQIQRPSSQTTSSFQRSISGLMNLLATDGMLPLARHSFSSRMTLSSPSSRERFSMLSTFGR